MNCHRIVIRRRQMVSMDHVKPVLEPNTVPYECVMSVAGTRRRQFILPMAAEIADHESLRSAKALLQFCDPRLRLSAHPVFIRHLIDNLLDQHDPDVDFACDIGKELGDEVVDGCGGERRAVTRGACR
jgi:hypothetical protein